MSKGDKNKKIIDGIEYQLSSCNELYSYNKRKQLHSHNDKPAIIYSDGTKYWFKNSKIHRDSDKPAVIWPDGTKEWWVNGRKQRNKYYVCLYIKDGKQHKEFFKTELQAKQCESDMLSNNICSWVEENV